MKNLVLSISFLLLMPSLLSHGMNVQKVNFEKKEVFKMNTVCVPFKATNPNFQNDAYFYTRECAIIFRNANEGTTLHKGNFCVNQNVVFECIN